MHSSIFHHISSRALVQIGHPTLRPLIAAHSDTVSKPLDLAHLLDHDVSLLRIAVILATTTKRGGDKQHAADVLEILEDGASGTSADATFAVAFLNVAGTFTFRLGNGGGATTRHGAGESRNRRGEAHHLAGEVEDAEDVVGGGEVERREGQGGRQLGRRDERLVPQVVRERDGLGELLQARHVVPVPVRAPHVGLDGRELLDDLLHALVDLALDARRDRLLELADPDFFFFERLSSDLGV